MRSKRKLEEIERKLNLSKRPTIISIIDGYGKLTCNGEEMDQATFDARYPEADYEVIQIHIKWREDGK